MSSALLDRVPAYYVSQLLMLGCHLVGPPLPAGPRAGSPGDLLHIKGESRQRPSRLGQALSPGFTCYSRGRRASPPLPGHARVAVRSIPRGENRQRSTRPERVLSHLICQRHTGVTSADQAVEHCRPACQSTRAPGSLGRPKVRRGFWPSATTSQAAVPYAAPLSLAAAQHFSGAGFTLAVLRFYG
ncbi:hypothetical protein NDU88_009768 [Pleurodeles waltl]|uniref:Uncharacterized protein n=1 Tax=Pleurodeles waltl TaxID=8319 RepID=A0AAV7PTD2_PLEWA|nr:hypothetical protein NDU88_009768 [Pleurodeles waltl]